MMKKFVLLLLVFASLELSAQYKLSDFKALHELTGSWKMPGKNGIIVEEWNQVSETLLQSRGYQLINTDTAYLESVQLELKNGKITCTATVFDQNEGKPVVFTLVNDKKGTYTFENKDHDFPQQIAYSVKDQTLNVVTGGKQQGEWKTISFSFTKM